MTTDAKVNEGFHDPKHEVTVDGRRKVALALFGALGAAAFAQSCADANGELPMQELEQARDPVAGTSFAWFDKIFPSTPNQTLKGTLGTANKIAIAEGYSAAGDGGGGVFWWDTSASSGDDGGTIIVPTGSSTGRWRRIYSGPLNAKWFGLKGNSSTEAAGNLNALVAATLTAGLPTTGAPIYFPSGVYVLPVPLKLVQARGTLIFGDGPTKTVLRALDATLDSIINLENCAICSVRDLSVEGPTPGTLVQNGIYIHRNGASPGLTPTNIKLSNLRVGRDDGASLNDGILFTYDQFATATSLQDPSVSNNDEHLIEDCEIVNCLSNGVDLFGPNILGVKILGGSISSSAPNSIGIGATGGSFTVFGTTIGVQQMMFRMNYGFAGNPNADSGGPNVWFQQYPVTIHSVLAETPATILWTSPDSGGYDVYVHFVGCSFKNGPRPGDPNVVAFNSQGKLTFTGCFMVPNMAGSTANFVAAHAQSDVLLSGCYLSFSSVNCAGRLTSVSNTWNTPVSFGASHVTAIGDVTSAAAARPLIFDTDAIGGSAGTAGSGVIYRNGQNQLFVS